MNAANKLFLTLTLSLGFLSASTFAESELAYVTNEKDDTISVIDLASYEVIKTINVGERPRGFIFNQDQTLAYICASDSDRIQILDVATDQIVGELPSGDDPETIALHPNDKIMYTANEDDALLTVIDIPTQQVITQIDVGVEPEGLAVSNAGDIVVATSETTNMVHWIHTQTNQNFANSIVGARPARPILPKMILNCGSVLKLAGRCMCLMWQHKLKSSKSISPLKGSTKTESNQSVLCF